MLPVPVLAKAGAHELEILDAAGNVVERKTVRIQDARFRRQNVVLSKSVVELKPSPGEMDTVREFRNTVSDKRHWEEPFRKPVPGCMTSPFGTIRLHNGKPTGSYHGGLDLRGATGTPVVAPADGFVKIAQMFNVHGGTVGIDHGQGVTSAYLHLSKLAAKEGSAVKKGDLIGYVGSTGRSSAPHLHWSLAVNGHHVNPLQWVRVPPCAAARPKKPKK